MEYSIHELSQLSGLTARALRWYDKKGLLKPCRVAPNGYRYYGEWEVDRLQDILFYRALGVELGKITEYLDAPDYDRVEALRGHLHALEAERDRLEDMIQSVKNTVDAEERNEKMSDEKKFEAFKRHVIEENERTYGKEAREKYGDDEVNTSNEAVLGLDRESYEEWSALEEKIKTAIENAVRGGIAPDAEEGREIARLHKQWLSVTVKNYDAAKHRGIAELYVADERFTAYYDKNVSGCARFLRDAVRLWIK